MSRLACGRKGYFARSSVVIEMESPDILLFGVQRVE